MNLYISEIFNSIQGETSYVGMPATFIRLGKCNLKCSWCDTMYSHYEYEVFLLNSIIEKVLNFGTKLVVVTGGEPLLQKKEVLELITLLCDREFTVLIETNGSLSIEGLDARVIVIIDIKCPGSGQIFHNYWPNIEYLKNGDELKFVIADKNDFDWAMSVINKYDLSIYHILITPVFGRVNLKDIAEWIKNSGLTNIRLNIQAHKYIWGNSQKGV